jgi:hypothetical protein
VSVFAFSRGHEITTVGSTVDQSDWRWADNGAPLNSETRPCARCGKPPGPDDEDACLGHLPGVVAACCGHGVDPAYVLFDDGSGISGQRALTWQRLMRERNKAHA